MPITLPLIALKRIVATAAQNTLGSVKYNHHHALQCPQ